MKHIQERMQQRKAAYESQQDNLILLVSGISAILVWVFL